MIKEKIKEMISGDTEEEIQFKMYKFKFNILLSIISEVI